MSFFPTQALPVGEVLLTTVRLWKKVFTKVQLLSFVGFLVGVSSYVGWAEIVGFNLFIKSDRTPQGVMFFIVCGFVMLIFSAAVYQRTYKVLEGEYNSFLSAISEGIRKVLPLIPAMIIISVSITAGYVAFILPGIFLTVVMTFYFPLIIVENLGPFSALKHCFRLVWGDWWRTACVILPPSIVFLTINWAVDYFGVDVIAATHGWFAEAWVLRHLMKLFLSAFYFPFFATLVLVQMNDLEIRKT